MNHCFFWLHIASPQFYANITYSCLTVLTVSWKQNSWLLKRKTSHLTLSNRRISFALIAKANGLSEKQNAFCQQSPAVRNYAWRNGARRIQRWKEPRRRASRRVSLFVCVCPRRWQRSLVAHCPGLVEPGSKWSLTAQTDVRLASAVAHCIIGQCPKFLQLPGKVMHRGRKGQLLELFPPLRSQFWNFGNRRSNILELVESEIIVFVPVWGFRFDSSEKVSLFYVDDKSWTTVIIVCDRQTWDI